MDEQKQAAVIRYLHVHYPGRFIEVQEDGRLDAVAFKIHLDQGDTRLLKVSNEFIEDTAEENLPYQLDRMEAGELLQRGPGNGVLATSNGATFFDRG